MTTFTPPPSAPPAAVDQPSRRTDQQEQFDIKTDAYMTWQTAFRNWLAGMRAWCVTMLGEMTQATEGAEAARVAANEDAILAMGYRNVANAAAGTATTQAGLATSARSDTVAARDAAAGYADAAGKDRALAGTARLRAEEARSGAEAAQGAAAAARDAAAVYASSQLKGSSTTSVAPGAGVKNLAMEPSRSFVVGMYLVITSNGDPGTWMSGYVKSYSQTTGALELTVDAFKGTMAKADWVIGVAAPGAAGGLALQVVTTNTSCVAGVAYVVAAPGITLTLPTSWMLGDSIQWIEAIGTGATYGVSFGATPLRGRAVGTQQMVARNSATPVLRYQDSTRGLV